MAALPDPVAEFLSERRIAVAGVSRDSRQPANAIVRKLRAAGHAVYAINPNASEAEGETCYPNVASLPVRVDRLVVATHPAVSVNVVREAADAGVRQVWFHRSFGQGSVSEAAVREGEARGMRVIVGGCPLMYCKPVDIGHRCMRWWLGRKGRVPR